MYEWHKCACRYIYIYIYIHTCHLTTVCSYVCVIATQTKIESLYIYPKIGLFVCNSDDTTLWSW